MIAHDEESAPFPLHARVHALVGVIGGRVALGVFGEMVRKFKQTSCPNQPAGAMHPDVGQRAARLLVCAISFSWCRISGRGRRRGYPAATGIAHGRAFDVPARAAHAVGRFHLVSSGSSALADFPAAGRAWPSPPPRIAGAQVVSSCRTACRSREAAHGVVHVAVIGLIEPRPFLFQLADDVSISPTYCVARGSRSGVSTPQRLLVGMHGGNVRTRRLRQCGGRFQRRGG